MNKRQMHFAGSFYPADSKSVEEMIHHFNRSLENSTEVISQLNRLKTNAVIVPHAGWIYSGFTANVAHRVLSGSPVDTVIVIGPSHHAGFEGVSIADYTAYATPLGDIPIDRALVQAIKEKFGVVHYPQAHHEHSTEVQMPFIRHYMPDVNVVELVYGYASPKLLEPIISYLLHNSRYAVVISTDLSHFYPLQEAHKIDQICLEAVEKMDLNLLHKGCEACGEIGVEAMLSAANKEGLKSLILDYRTSADASGDTARVVGYMSALFQKSL